MPENSLRLVGAPGSTSADLLSSAPLDFDVLFRRFAPYVARIAYKLTGNDRDAEDICQEVFLRLSSKLHTLCTVEDVRPWLATVTVRVARRHMHRFRFWTRMRRPNDPGDIDVDTAGVCLPADDKVALTQLYAKLATLPARQRTAWVLFHGEGHALEEIAAICGQSLSTTKRDLVAARSALQEAFK